MASNRGILGAGGGFGTGLLLLIGGLIVKHSQANLLAECTSGLGQLGQAFDPNAATECSSAQDLSSLATGAIWIGGIMLVIAVGSFIAFLAAAGVVASNKKVRAAVLGPDSARPVKPGPGTSARSPVDGAEPKPAGPVNGAEPKPAGPVSGAEPKPAGPVNGAEPKPAGPVSGHQKTIPAGPGCGHELRPGARFCTVCGRAAAANAPTAEPPVPAPGMPAPRMPVPRMPVPRMPVPGMPAPGMPVPAPAPTPEITVTAVRPVPPRPGPAYPSPPTTTPNGFANRPHGGTGFVSQAEWAQPAPSPGAPLPRHDAAGPGGPLPRHDAAGPGGPLPRHDAAGPGGPLPRHAAAGPDGARRHRSRWPLAVGLAAILAAGGLAAVLILQPFRSSPAAAGASPASTPPSSASGTPTPTSSPPSPQQSGAENLAALLAQSVSDRSSIVHAVNSVSRCGQTLSQDPQILQKAATSRRALLSRLANLPGRSALPAGMLQELAGAWRASARADRDFARWAQDEMSQGCTPNDQSDPNFQAAAGPDARATAGKQAFVKAWNPMAEQYGLTTYNWDQL